MAKPSPKALAAKLGKILARDREADDGLLKIDRYVRGEHDDPYIPDFADDEYRLLAKRAVSNWLPLIVGTPAQAMYVDGYRPGRAGKGWGGAPEPVQDSDRVHGSTQTFQWDFWQRSRFDARQGAVYRGALQYGHSFVCVEQTAFGVIGRGLSALRTAAIFNDPASDDAPIAAMTVVSWPDDDTKGTAEMWDATTRYVVRFGSLSDANSYTVTKRGKHGAKECPVTRFAAYVDLEGRTRGVVSPLITLQDRINQTVFDLLIAQTYASFKVRYATGMAPPIVRDENGDPVLDKDGNPIPVKMNHNARRFLFAEDPDVKFGSLDETPLDGYINSIDMSVRHLAAVSQTPPHHLLGQIANLSAEALAAAETSLSRMVEELRKTFGESWERVFRVAAQIAGEAGALDYHGEVIWRDMEARSLSMTVDALGKMADQLDIPRRGLWPRVPGVTQAEIDTWHDMRDDDDYVAQLAQSSTRASGARSTSSRYIPPESRPQAGERAA
ncbi:phage portal protein [Cellulosimicrobium sp. ES-005]|uniref:Phage portal protein n=1 Tax=Cellulosimicrobium sp. ES-005 TaxID=3163031 RepID=A0AAU8FYH2_9MICO